MQDIGDHSSGPIEAWIDVGGTFTDCLVRTPTGQILRGKTLSSGRLPVSPPRLEQGHYRLPELAQDGSRFWCGAMLRGYAADGQLAWQAIISDSQPGGLLELRSLSRSTEPAAERFEIDPGCEAPVLVVRRLLQVPLADPLPSLVVRLGTTRGTNALLTRGGATTALLVTQPFVQLLDIGDQTRPDLFALDINQPQPLAALTLGVVERLSADGRVLVPLDRQQAEEQLRRAKRQGCDSLAISLLHSYRNPVHELELECLARAVGFEQISLSACLAPVIEYVARTQTTVVDAYLSPIIRRYLNLLQQQFGRQSLIELNVMTSAGGLIDWRSYSGKDSILSGPAGGVVALRGLSAALQQDAIIGLDMGGTSTDVCRVDRNLQLQYESTKAGVRMLTPNLPVETIAAGGGSLCWFDGVSLRVGPQSAGAEPGPACYGRGGPLTITDLNFVSGRIPAGQFPFPLDLSASWRRIDRLLEQIAPVLGRWSRDQLVEGFRRLANQQMADAVRSVSIKQGADPREHLLVGFGGAAGQHICEIAEALGMGRIVDHPDAGLLSALGMGLADQRLESVIPVYQRLAEVDWPAVGESLRQLSGELVGRLRSWRGSESPVATELAIELRYQGTDATLAVPVAMESIGDARLAELPARLMEQFSARHRQRFGYLRPGHALELVALRLSAVVGSSHALPPAQVSEPRYGLQPSSSRSASGDRYPCFARADLVPGSLLAGPAIVLNAGSTLTVERGWSAEALSDGTLWLTRTEANSRPVTAADSRTDSTARMDPVLRDCFAQRLSAIATQMGLVLQQTAVSVNVKQRRDFSCAIFDRCGQLLANAPHVPVHLGAMGQTVRSIIARFPDVRPGDSFLCNDPYEGGSHLPDLTVILPVFSNDEAGWPPQLFVANRAHHADIGGLAPGSMSIRAQRLEQEGVIIPPMRLTRGGHSNHCELEQWVRRAAYPPRNWSENVADIDAQLAACRRGEQLLHEFAAELGWSEIARYAAYLQDAGEARMRQFIQADIVPRMAATAGRSLSFADALEDGTPIRVELSVGTDGRLRVDFTGTGPASRWNYNANPSIVTAAVLYVLRCLIQDELPLNEGVLRAVQLDIPQSVLNPAAAGERGASPAVAAGNVETSQRVVDVLLAALGAAAASQGTMNNVLFGNQDFGFYETICGGAGATPTAAGASAVHTHMTNTRLTDPELLESRYPVRLVDFRIRAASGGQGMHPGGHGVVRTFEFLQPVTLSLLTSRRGSRPFGLAGGGPGQSGENWLEDECRRRQRLDANCELPIQAGWRVTIATPGGGGYGGSIEA